MRAFLIVVAMTALVSCEATLEDGRFACLDGQCPDGFTCRGDQLCYGPDAPLTADYAACGDGSECASGRCTRAPSQESDAPGLCSIVCTGDDDCPPPSDGSMAICTFGTCTRVCDSPTDCPAGSQCLIAPGRDPLAVCAVADEPAFEGRVGCTSDAGCQPPTRCRIPSGMTSGICAWPCSPDVGCPATADCVRWPGSMPEMICLGRCGGPGGGVCTAGATCLAATEPSTPYCVGSTWTSLPP